MKKFLSVILAASMLLTFTACNGSNSTPSQEQTSSDSASSTDSSTASTAENSVSAPASSEAESAAEPTAEADDTRTDYEKMVDRSLLSTGDMTRMANVFQKAQNGEDITVAYIGGSITEGYNAGTTEF